MMPKCAWFPNYSLCEWGQNTPTVSLRISGLKCISGLRGYPDGSASRSMGLSWSSGLLCNLQGCRPKTLPTFSNLLCPILNQPLSHMEQHVAYWVAPYTLSQQSLPPALKFLNTLPSPHHILLSLLCTRVRGNHLHHHHIFIASDLHSIILRP